MTVTTSEKKSELIVTMSDVNLESLKRRCKEKESQGYEYVTDIKNLFSTSENCYKKGYAGAYAFKGFSVNNKYKVAMRKIK